MENEFEWMWSNATPQQQAVPFRSFDEVQGERNALKRELQQNEARIAELKAQLEQNRMDADELDRRLAANRAGIGDTATSLAHQRNIDDRAYKAAMTAYANSTRETEKRSLAEGQKKKLIEEIEDIDLQLNSSWADPKAEPTLLAKRKRLVDELNVLGEKYTEYKKADESLADWERFKEAHTDKRGNWDSKENKAIYDSQSQDTIEGVKNVKTSGKTQDEVNDAARKVNEKANAAIDEVIKNTSEYDVVKNGGKVTKRANNGKYVTIEMTADGSLFATSGSVKRPLKKTE